MDKKQDMDKKQELSLYATYEKLLELSKNEKVTIEDRLSCAFNAGCIKPGLSMESMAVIGSIIFNIKAGQKLIKKYYLLTLTLLSG